MLPEKVSKLLRVWLQEKQWLKWKNQGKRKF
jgi:hypothetical protein